MSKRGQLQSIIASATAYGAVTKSDSTALEFHALWIGTAGDVVVKITADADPVTFKNVPVGWLPVCGERVMAATTAADIVWATW
jgi:hypothetical protein